MAKIIRNKKASIDNNLLQRLETNETIQPIPHTDHYFVTNRGRVFSSKKLLIYEMEQGNDQYCQLWKELKQRLANGYLSVNIDNKRQYVHKLVYKSFNTFIDTKEVKIVHIDKNKLNNNVNNLCLAWRNKNDTLSHEQYSYRLRMLDRVDLNLLGEDRMY